MITERIIPVLRVTSLITFVIVLGIIISSLKPRVVLYRNNHAIDFSLYNSDTNIEKLFDDCIVIHADSASVYEKGKYTDTGIEGLLLFKDGTFLCSTSYINSIFNTTYSEDYVDVNILKEELRCDIVNYENKMCIINTSNRKISLFDNLYTIEALNLRLTNRGEDNLNNEFIDLPYLITNGNDNAVFFSEPNLHLGIQTEIYSNQLKNKEIRPYIVAGEGEYKDNTTIVRVFNSEQTCISQFLAYSQKVKGGVQVKALKTENDIVMIATAPYNDRYLNSKSIRIFDMSGNLHMEIIPKLKAPYVIATGYFLGNTNEEQLLVTEMYPDESINIEIYSVLKGKLIKSISLDNHEKGRMKVEVIRDKSGNSSLLLFFTGKKALFKADLNAKTVTKVNIDLPEGANGVYPGKSEGEYTITTDEDTFSNIYKMKENNTSDIINVGWRENRFYSNFAKENPDLYVDYGSFQHLRMDLSSKIMSKLVKLDRVEDVLSNSDYSEWKRDMSSKEIELYHSNYVMWEPCFTHRWNRMTQTTNMSKIMDEETNLPKYASIGKDNEGSDYLELDSSFLIGTYADGLLSMGKLRLYPLRDFLQDLSKEFKSEPERLIAVSPVHEHEINVRDSIGDYNYSMILGFRSYLLNLYNSVDKINDKFGTEFKSIDEIDPPRDSGRGDWDAYGKSEYFDLWSLYNRFIINKRIIEAYREALVAGFPPEAINAHQIPEGDAVAGFLGEANTRLSPIDVVMSCGTGFGGTRYGYWFQQEHNWLSNARLAGHKNITIGEYSSLSQADDPAFNQLQYLFNNGVKMTHVLVPYPNTDDAYKLVKESEQYAINRLQIINSPRPGYTGGTTDINTIVQGDKSYSIVRLGVGDNQNGLLKSINDNGSWEGSIYLVPFHSRVEVDSISFNNVFSKYIKTKNIESLHHGDQIELTFNSKKQGYIKVYAMYDGEIIENSIVKFESTKESKPFRYVFSNQLSLTDNVNIVIEIEGNSKISNLNCTVQRESVARKYFGRFNSAEHKGGISYDILSRDMLG